MNQEKARKHQKLRDTYYEYGRTKNKLVVIYTAIMGIIVTLAILAVCGYIWKIRRDRQWDTFKNSTSIVSHQLQSENVITNDWLSSMETKYHMLIQIEDNGKPLQQHSSWMSVVERQVLFEDIEEQSAIDGSYHCSLLIREK